MNSLDVSSRVFHFLSSFVCLRRVIVSVFSCLVSRWGFLKKKGDFVSAQRLIPESGTKNSRKSILFCVERGVVERDAMVASLCFSRIESPWKVSATHHSLTKTVCLRWHCGDYSTLPNEPNKR